MKNTKRFIALLICLTMLFATVSMSVEAIAVTDTVKCESGDGTIENPYVIKTADQLLSVNNDLSASYILGANIDLSSVENWTPIGTDTAPFTGTFDGNGCIIYDVSINIHYDSNDLPDVLSPVGLFGQTTGATITNLGIENARYNISADDSDSELFSQVGGIVGTIQNTTIDSCYFKGTINNVVGNNIYSRAAGITTGGVNSTVSNCYSCADIYAKSYNKNTMVAGLVAWLDNVTIDKCYVTGSVTGENTTSYCYVGGANASGNAFVIYGAVLSYGGTVKNSVFMLRTLSANGTTNYKNDIGNYSKLSNNKVLAYNSEAAENQSTYENLGWDFSSVWVKGDTYPSLKAFLKIPSGYNFETDRYYFGNIYKRIDKEYYTGMFGEQKGTELFINDVVKVSTTGHCYGLATTTGAILMGYPEVSDFSSWLGLPYSNLVDVKKGSGSDKLNITLIDYVKYCVLYQISFEISEMLKDVNHKKYHNVYEAVKNASLNNPNTTAIVIIFDGENFMGSNGKGGHAVYAVGIDGKDILVNDSEIPGEIQRIKVKENGYSWEYVTPDYSFSSKAGYEIKYVDDVLTPFEHLMYGEEIECEEIKITEESELLANKSHFSTRLKPFDRDKLLVVSENDGFSFSSPDNMYEIYSVNGTDNSATESRLYWLSESDTIEAQNTGEDSAVLKLVGNELKISASVPAESGAKITVNENGENKISFDTDEGEFISFTFTTLDENNEFIDTVISGTAHGCDVTAEATEAGGIKVNGLDNIHISYETSDLVVDTEVNVDDGSSVNISVNENEIITDWKCPHSTDENADNICDNCGEVIDSVPDKECTHMCHSSNSFLQFIWKIVNFFSKLFNMNPVCSCGDKHY